MSRARGIPALQEYLQEWCEQELAPEEVVLSRAELPPRKPGKRGEQDK